jgi:hypothetical protein
LARDGSSCSSTLFTFATTIFRGSGSEGAAGSAVGSAVFFSSVFVSAADGVTGSAVRGCLTQPVTATTAMKTMIIKNALRNDDFIVLLLDNLI